MQLEHNQQPLLAGLYADPVSHEVHGAVQIKPLASGTTAYVEYPFDKNTIENINTRDKQESAEEYTVRRVVLEENGSTVFFAESYRRGPTVKSKLILSGKRDIYTSFSATHDGENYYLIFNNSIKNSSDVSLVILSKTGDIQLKTLYDRSDYRIRIVPGLALELRPGHLIIPVEKSNNRALVDIKF